MRDEKGRFCKANNVVENNKGVDKINAINTKEKRMDVLKENGINTSNFFNLNMNIPVGANVQITIDGVPYTINSNNDIIVKEIMDKGYVFNSRTDGRFVTAQTFRMLKGYSYNGNECEVGWNAYLKNCYGFMYQFSMMQDEVHRLAKMEKKNDPEFEKLSRFFTKDVVIETCSHYLRQLKKYAQSGQCPDGNLVEVMCCEGGCIKGNATIASEKTAKKLLNEILENSSDIKKGE